MIHKTFSNAGRLTTQRTERRSLSVRFIMHRLLQSMRRLYLRLFYPQLRFGSRFDVGADLELRLTESAQVDFGNECILDRGVTIQCEGHIKVGNRTSFGHHCTLAACDMLTIGDDCLIAEMVSIRDHDHRFDLSSLPIRNQGVISAPVQIGHNVWLGAKVTVVKGVTIGDNAVIGANAVVTKDIPANAVAVGVPARVIRYRGCT